MSIPRVNFTGLYLTELQKMLRPGSTQRQWVLGVTLNFPSAFLTPFRLTHSREDVFL